MRSFRSFRVSLLRTVVLGSSLRPLRLMGFLHGVRIGLQINSDGPSSGDDLAAHFLHVQRVPRTDRPNSRSESPVSSDLRRSILITVYLPPQLVYAGCTTTFPSSRKLTRVLSSRTERVTKL